MPPRTMNAMPEQIDLVWRTVNGLGARFYLVWRTVNGLGARFYLLARRIYVACEIVNLFRGRGFPFYGRGATAWGRIPLLLAYGLRTFGNARNHRIQPVQTIVIAAQPTGAFTSQRY
jgi:hypothetical protein